MGIPIESRLSAAARRKRQRVARSLSIPEDSTTRRFHQHDAFSERRRTFGVNHDALEAVAAHYTSTTRSASPPRKARLVLLRTVLPVPVRVHRSPVSHLGSRIANMLADDNDSDDLFAELRARRRWRSPRDRLALQRRIAEFVMSDSDDSEEDQRVEEEGSSPTRPDSVPLTSAAVSILFEEEGDPVTAKAWEIGCWAGTHQLAGVDMFQVFLDVLTEATRVPTCPIEALCIANNLDSCVAVVDGVNLLKDLSAELHTTYDKNSNYFLHPITGNPIEIAR